MPWGYSSPINVLFAKITDNSTIKGGRWRGGIKERSSDTKGENRKRNERETRDREVGEKGARATEEKRRMDQLGRRRRKSERLTSS